MITSTYIHKKGIAFVCFQTTGEAQAAIDEFDGKSVEGIPEPLYVKPFQKKRDLKEQVHEHYAAMRSEKLLKDQTCNLFVKGLPLNTTTEEINEYFTEYGPVESVKRKTVDRVENNEKKEEFLGMAFVRFKEYESACKAIRRSNQRPFKGVLLKIDYYEPYEVKKAKENEAIEEAKKALARD